MGRFKKTGKIKSIRKKAGRLVLVLKTAVRDFFIKVNPGP